MKKIKSLYTLLIPVTMLAVTSCNKGAQKLTFLNALEYAQNNYDSHIYDDVKGVYTLALDNLNANLNINAYNEYGLVVQTEVTAGFKDIQLTCGGLPAICMSSKALNAINVAYTKFAAMSLEFVTHIGVEFGYTVENGCMTLKVGTNTNDGLLNILKCGFPYLNGYLTYQGVTEFMSGKPLGVLMLMGLGMAPNSTAEGDVSFTITTDNEGFVNGMTFNMSATNLDLHLATGILPVVPGYTDLNYTVDVTGGMSLGFSIKANF